jgi:acyl-homoserine lactone acylase PvdQ
VEVAVNVPAVRRTLLVALAALGLLVPLVPARAAAPVAPFGANDYGGFRDVLPPGTNGLLTAAQLAAFRATGVRPRHSDDQLAMYRDLLTAAPGLSAATLPAYFKDATFGVPAGQAERTYSPGGRSDVTVVRDRAFGVPHVYATTRAGAMFGLGYVSAEDRLFFMDVLRHLGRAQLSSFLGGSPFNRQLDQTQWEVAPYTEADLQRQLDLLVQRFGADGQQVVDDAQSYRAGVNAYIAEAKTDPGKMPSEYSATGHPDGPAPWQLTDTIAIAAVVGTAFGEGGGQELDSVRLMQAFQARFGQARGLRLWRQFTALNDPEAGTTVRGARFPYETLPRRVAPGSSAVPQRGSLVAQPLVVDGADAGTAVRSEPAPLAFPTAASNALVVSGRESASGHPLAVFGPQVGYFAPEILMEQDVHGPGIDARGAAFPGANLYVEMGHGRDYAWSATSGGQDTIDTFAVDLCNPDGSTPSTISDHYMFRGQCLPIEVLRQSNSWSPTPADSTPAGSQTLEAQRTQLGLVAARGLVRGQPVAFVKLRSTYFHEADSAPGLADLNDPDKIHGPQDFQAAVARIGLSFNWFYVDDRDVAYFNSGANPVRAPSVDPLLPTRAAFEWRNWDPDTWTSDVTPPFEHPQAVNQSWLTSWNNRQAPGYAGALPNVFGPVYRSDLLDARVGAATAGSRTMTLPQLVSAMEDAATVDLRGARILPWALAVIGRSRDPRLAPALDLLHRWVRAGAHRLDADRDGDYDQAAAVQLMDAWWPRLLQAEFGPTMGRGLFATLGQVVPFDDSPNGGGQHVGSAYQTGWYGYASKDLRTILRRRVRGRYARVFCGGGELTRCRRALTESLRAALRVDAGTLYHDGVCAGAGRDGDQTCFDSIWFRPIGGLTFPLAPWQNRPTYQQAVEVQGHRPR